MTNQTSATLVGIQVGKIQTLGGIGSPEYGDESWKTAFFKEPVDGPAELAQQGFLEDAQADRKNHGGVDKAVLAYAARHYPDWMAELGVGEMPYGGFGENLTWRGADEQTVCLGDVWQSAAGVRLQISQPRQPCWKMARRWGVPDLPKRAIESVRCGWYCRVLSGGSLRVGDELTLQDRPYQQWTIDRVQRAFYDQSPDAADLMALANIPELSLAWRDVFLQKLDRLGG